jgi:hypothetical protein
MNHENLERNESYKFVEVDGVFDFFDTMESHVSHVPKGRKPESAGMVFVEHDGSLSISSTWSSTCEVGCDAEAAHRMANSTGRIVKH